METAEMNTKTVEGYFGQKQVTRDEFVKQWKSSVNELFYVTTTRDDHERVLAIQASVAEMAGRKWDELK